MYFQASRFDARLDEEGNVVLLADQNRQKWNAALIAQGVVFLNKASEGQEISTYHIEAALASYHAQAKNFESTNWQAIVYLYRLLEQIIPFWLIFYNFAIWDIAESNLSKEVSMSRSTNGTFIVIKQSTFVGNYAVCYFIIKGKNLEKYL